jgi:hypothetical protein
MTGEASERETATSAEEDVDSTSSHPPHHHHLAMQSVQSLQEAFHLLQTSASATRRSEEEDTTPSSSSSSPSLSSFLLDRLQPQLSLRLSLWKQHHQNTSSCSTISQQSFLECYQKHCCQHTQDDTKQKKLKKKNKKKRALVSSSSNNGTDTHNIFVKDVLALVSLAAIGFLPGSTPVQGNSNNISSFPDFLQTLLSPLGLCELTDCIYEHLELTNPFQEQKSSDEYNSNNNTNDNSNELVLSPLKKKRRKTKAADATSTSTVVENVSSSASTTTTTSGSSSSSSSSSTNSTIVSATNEATLPIFNNTLLQPQRMKKPIVKKNSLLKDSHTTNRFLGSQFFSHGSTHVFQQVTTKVLQPKKASSEKKKQKQEQPPPPHPLPSSHKAGFHPHVSKNKLLQQPSYLLSPVPSSGLLTRVMESPMVTGKTHRNQQSSSNASIVAAALRKVRQQQPRRG